MKWRHIAPFVVAFPIPDYYVSEEGVRDSLQRRYPFNVIQPSAGAKVDLVPLPRDPFTRVAFRRRQRLEYDEAGRTAVFITPEDIVVAKLLAFQKTGSDKHLSDARGVLVIQWEHLELKAVRRRARASGVLDHFESMLEAASREVEE